MKKTEFIPQYRMIYNTLKSQIQSGVYADGSRLPCERELCSTYQVQRVTVRKALDLLVEDHLICKRAGLGTFVRLESENSPAPVGSGTILFIMSKSVNDIRSNASAFNAQLFFTMEQLYRDRGYTLLYTGATSDQEISSLVRKHQVVGAFLVSTVPDSFVTCLQQLRIPAVCLNHYDARVPSVLPANYDGIYEQVLHLQQLGHRRIAFLGGKAGSWNSDERQQGFIAAMNSAGLSPARVYCGNWTYDSGIACVEEMMGRPERPTAIIAASDMMAIGAMEGASRLGLKVPEDLSVIGFDNIQMARFCSPRLSSVGPDAQQMAHVAIQLCGSLIENGISEYDGYIVRIPVTFTDRASVAAVPAGEAPDV